MVLQNEGRKVKIYLDFKNREKSVNLSEIVATDCVLVGCNLTDRLID